MKVKEDRQSSATVKETGNVFGRHRFDNEYFSFIGQLKQGLWHSPQGHSYTSPSEYAPGIFPKANELVRLKFSS